MNQLDIIKLENKIFRVLNYEMLKTLFVEKVETARADKAVNMNFVTGDINLNVSPNSK